MISRASFQAILQAACAPWFFPFWISACGNGGESNRAESGPPPDSGVVRYVPGDFADLTLLSLVRDWRANGPAGGDAAIASVRAVSVDVHGNIVVLDDVSAAILGTTPTALQRTQSAHYTDDGLFLVTHERIVDARDRQDMSVRQLDPLSGELGEPVVRRSMPPYHELAPGVSMPALFASLPRAAVTRDGHIYSTQADSFHIDVTSPQGRVLYRLLARLPRIEPSAADIEAAIAERTAALEADDDFHRSWGIDVGKRDFHVTKIAGHHPALGHMLASSDGGVLVERLDVGNPWTAPDRTRLWDWIGPDRRLVGRIRIDRGFRPYFFGDCALIGVERDDLDAPSIVRYRIAFRNSSPCS
jgi:hypothetical protein